MTIVKLKAGFVLSMVFMLLITHGSMVFAEPMIRVADYENGSRVLIDNAGVFMGVDSWSSIHTSVRAKNSMTTSVDSSWTQSYEEIFPC